MHELSIAQSLFDIILEESERNHLKQVHVVKLQIGMLAAVVPDSLRFCFELVTKDTLAEGAILEIVTSPIVAQCSKCKFKFDVENHMFLCPQCGDPAVSLISGRDMALMSMEGETGDADDSDQSSGSPKHPSGQ